MPQEARVGLRFAAEGIQDVLQQIGLLAEAMGQVGRYTANPYNPALSMSGAPGTMGDIQMSGEPGTFSSGGFPAGMPGGYGGGPMVPVNTGGPQYAQGGGGFGSANITISRVDTLTVHQAGVVNVYAAGAGGGGGMVGGGGLADPGMSSIYRAPMGGRGGGGASSIGLQRYYDAFEGGATDQDYVSWQQTQYQQWVGGGGQGSFSDFLSGVKPPGGRGFLSAFGQNLFGGIPGIGSMMGGAGAAVAGGLAAGYAVHLGMQAASTAMAPMLSGQTTTDESLASQLLGIPAGIPIIGMPFGMAQQRVQSLDAMRNTGSRLSGLYGVSSAHMEQIADNSGRTMMDQLLGAALNGIADGSPVGMIAHAFGWTPGRALGLTADPTNTATGIPNLRSREAMEAMSALIEANPAMSDDAAAALATQIATNPAFGKRPAGIMAGVGRVAGALSSRNANPYLMGGALSGASLSSSDILTMAQEAAASGDLSGVQSLEQAGRAQGLDISAFGSLKATAVSMAQFGQGSQIAALQMGLVQGGQQMVGSTLGGWRAMSGAISAEGPAADEQLANVRQRIARVQSGNLNDPDQMKRLLELQAEEQRIQIGISSRPFRQIQNQYEGQMMGANASSSYGQSTLEMTRGLLMGSGSEMSAAFGAITQGKQEAVSAAQTRLSALLGQGLTDDNENVRAARAAVRQAEGQVRMDSTFRRETTYQADTEIGGFAVAGGQAMLGTAGRHELYGGAGTQRAQAVLMGGLNEQLDAALTAMSDTLRDPGATAGQRRQAGARVEQARASIDSAIASYIQQVAQDQFAGAGQQGALARIQISGVTGAGFAPSGALQGQETAGLQAQLAQAQANAAAATDPRQRMFWEQQAAQLQSQLMTLPLTQIEQRLAPAIRSAQAGQSIASAEVQIARQGGAGSADTRGMEGEGIKAADSAVAAAEQRVQERRALVEQGKLDPSMLREAEAQAAQARLNASQARTALGDVVLPMAMQERREVTDYSLNILRNTPGAYGNIRGLLGAKMGELEENAAYLRNEYEERTGMGATEQGRMNIRRQLRQIGTEQHEAYQELSHGWEGRLLNQMSGSPGRFSLDGRGFSYRDSVLHGVMNPHMGMSAGQMPHFLRQIGGIDGGPSLMPGARNADSDVTGTRFGGDIFPDGFSGLGRKMIAPGYDEGRYPEGAVMEARSGGRGAGVTTIEVVIKDQRGNELGRGRPGASGAVADGIAQGGLGDTLGIMGITVARQQ